MYKNISMSFLHVMIFIDKVHEGGDIYTFNFKKPKDFNYKAGQHGLWIQASFTRPHPFTLSSSPEEEYVSFSTHIRLGSRYKQKLASLTAGDKMYLLGPILDFSFKDDVHEYVFLAQGIGITPFRSMLLHAKDSILPVTTTLIHVENEPHTFRQLTSSCATVSHYPTTPGEFQGLVKDQSKKATYYISGSPGFISSVKELLSEQGIDKNHIKTDSFLGY